MLKRNTVAAETTGHPAQKVRTHISSRPPSQTCKFGAYLIGALNNTWSLIADAYLPMHGMFANVLLQLCSDGTVHREPTNSQLRMLAQRA